MYNHGFSTLALAESYGAVDDPRLGPALQKAVRLIVNAQKVNSLHAWRYSPESQDADTTVSGAQMVALFAARNAGMAVPEETIQNGLNFFLSCQTPDGGFGYISPNAPNATRTAIACVVLLIGQGKKHHLLQKGLRVSQGNPAATAPIHNTFSTTPRRLISTARRSYGRVGTAPTSSRSAPPNHRTEIGRASNSAPPLPPPVRFCRWR